MSRILFNFCIALAFSLLISPVTGQTPYPVRGICIAAPSSERLEIFLKTIDEVFSEANINTLILRIDFRYQYQSRPELVDDGALSREQIKKLVEVCRKNDIRLIPQINLLGHQSWHSNLGKLLEVYPEFDETPGIKLPEEYEWPNEDGLYCKSYCPQHPDVHEVVFDLVDEIVEVFEADAFHAGLDEVFYLAHEDCPRCVGKDPAKLFAGEVNRINRHLDSMDAELWMWGDRLLDGRPTDIGMWEGSFNNTYPAIDMIDKDVVICDWHYDSVPNIPADSQESANKDPKTIPTAMYFARKGFRVVSCPWRNADVAIQQEKMMRSFVEKASPGIKSRFMGMVHTVWSNPERFMEEYKNAENSGSENTSGNCFRALSERWKE